MTLTGRRDALGRTVYRGPRGGEYVLTARGKSKPSTASRMAPALTGRTNARGRSIYQGPRGGEFVRLASGRKGKPSVASRRAPTPTGRTDAMGRTVYRGQRGGTFVRGRGGTRLRPAKGRPPPVVRPPGWKPPRYDYDDWFDVTVGSKGVSYTGPPLNL